MFFIIQANIVKPEFWKKNLRYIFIGLIILGAFITPDGSGITMWFIVGPMMLLYIIGMTTIRIDSKIFKI